MKEIGYVHEKSLADEFEAKSGGIAELLQNFVESAPWLVSSVILHIVIFAGLALMTIGGSNEMTAVNLESEFEQTPTPEETIEETMEPVETLEPEYNDEKIDDSEFDEIEEPEDIEIDGDPDSPTDQPLSDELIGVIGIGPGHPSGAYSRGRGKNGRGKGFNHGMTKISEVTVNRGLKWLADHQEPDGHWDTKKWGGHATYDPGITGLALLAFAGAGHTERSGKYRRTVSKAINWLSKQQDKNGNFAPGETMYSHAIPTLALLEEVAMAPVPRTKSVAKRGLEYMLSAQNEYKAWRYWPKDNDNDLSVTTWCVMALKAAKIAKMDVPSKAWAGVRSFLDEITEQSYSEVGYTSRPIRGGAEQTFQKYSMTACGVLCRLYMGVSRDDRVIKNGVQILMEHLPEWNQSGINAPFYYYWYYGSLALFQIEGSAWKKWNEKMQPLLVQHQILKEGELYGSFDPPTTHFGQMGGRVYSTAMAVLTLEVYYRYEIIAGAGNSKKKK